MPHQYFTKTDMNTSHVQTNIQKHVLTLTYTFSNDLKHEQCLNCVKITINTIMSLTCTTNQS